MASTPAVIMTAPPTKVRRKASLRARIRSDVDTVVLVMAWSLEVAGGVARAVSATPGTKRGDPKAAPVSLRGRLSAHYLPETRNSGCAMATFLGALLKAG